MRYIGKPMSDVLSDAADRFLLLTDWYGYPLADQRLFHSTYLLSCIGTTMPDTESR